MKSWACLVLSSNAFKMLSASDFLLLPTTSTMLWPKELLKLGYRYMGGGSALAAAWPPGASEVPAPLLGATGAGREKLPMAQQEGHRSMCQASSSAANFFFVKNNIKVNQLVNGWVTNCNNVCTQITTLPSMQLQKGKLKKEQKKRKGMCAKRVWVLTISLPNSTVSLETSCLRSMFAIESMVLVSRKAHRGSENGFVFNPCCRLSTYSICKKKETKKLEKKYWLSLKKSMRKKICAGCKLKKVTAVATW